jgi:hypothetical protein
MLTSTDQHPRLLIKTRASTGGDNL